MNECSVPGCRKQAAWTRKPGWMIAPGSPGGAVCHEHHCWESVNPWERNNIVVTRNEAGALVFQSFIDGEAHSVAIFKDEGDWLPALLGLIEVAIP